MCRQPLQLQWVFWKRICLFFTCSSPVRTIREWSAPSSMSSAWITLPTWRPLPTCEEVSTHHHEHCNIWTHTAGVKEIHVSPTFITWLHDPSRQEVLDHLSHLGKEAERSHKTFVAMTDDSDRFSWRLQHSRLQDEFSYGSVFSSHFLSASHRVRLEPSLQMGTDPHWAENGEERPYTSHQVHLQYSVSLLWIINTCSCVAVERKRKSRGLWKVKCLFGAQTPLVKD